MRSKQSHERLGRRTRLRRVGGGVRAGRPNTTQGDGPLLRVHSRCRVPAPTSAPHPHLRHHDHQQGLQPGGHMSHYLRSAGREMKCFIVSKYKICPQRLIAKILYAQVCLKI